MNNKSLEKRISSGESAPPAELIVEEAEDLSEEIRGVLGFEVDYLEIAKFIRKKEKRVAQFIDMISNGESFSDTERKGFRVQEIEIGNTEDRKSYWVQFYSSLEFKYTQKVTLGNDSKLGPSIYLDDEDFDFVLTLKNGDKKRVRIEKRCSEEEESISIVELPIEG